MTTGNPLAEIEDRKAQTDLGAFAYNLYQGARAAGASRNEARHMVKAFFAATFQANAEATEASADQPDEDER